MKNETSEKPKCLVHYKGKSLLARQIDVYERSPIEEIGLITGYKCNLLNRFKLKKFHNYEWKNSNMIHSLTFANQWLLSYECIISYSDIFFEDSAVIELMKTKSEITLLYDKEWRKLWEKRFENPLLDAETLKLDNKNKVLEIGKKTNNFNNIEGQFMGIFKTTPNGWNEVLKIKEKLHIDEYYKIDTTSIFQKIIDTNSTNIVGVEYNGEWGEIDIPTDLLLYNENKNAF